MTDPIIDKFRQQYSDLPEAIAIAPGRVNLIGEHTDYNEGFVLPTAIDRGVRIAFRKREDTVINLYSIEYNESLRINAGNLEQRSSGWKEYVKAIAWILTREGFPLVGWDGVIAGDVPIGAGLSSSAAFELAVARTFVYAAGGGWDPVRMAQLAQKAENERIGVQCGIMDQLTSACDVAGKALLIDCRSLQIEPVGFPGQVSIVVLDTTTRRELADSGYNIKRTQCEQAARYFRVKTLRDLTLEDLKKAVGTPEPALFGVARHVVTENVRTLAAADALRKNDMAVFGRLMVESHTSLRIDMGVSSDYLDRIVEIALGQPGCHGARMTGAGFAGCAVALVEENLVDGFSLGVSEQFLAQTGIRAKIYPCKTANGAHVKELTEDPRSSSSKLS